MTRVLMSSRRSAPRAAMCAIALGILLNTGQVSAAPPAALSPGANLAVVFGGDRQGEMEPCGCRDKNAGGIDREAKSIADLRASGAPILAVETGGLLYPGRRSGAEDVTLEYYYRILTKLGYSAINVGAADFALGLDKLKRWQQESGAPLVSANIVDAQGRPVFAPYRTFTFKDAAGRDYVVGVTGVTATKYMWDLDVKAARGIPTPTPAAPRGTPAPAFVTPHASPAPAAPLSAISPEAPATAQPAAEDPLRAFTDSFPRRTARDPGLFGVPTPPASRTPIVPVIPGYAAFPPAPIARAASETNYSKPAAPTPKPALLQEQEAPKTDGATPPQQDPNWLKGGRSNVDLERLRREFAPTWEQRATAQAQTAPPLVASDAIPLAAPAPAPTPSAPSAPLAATPAVAAAVIAPHREKLGEVLKEMKAKCDVTVVLFEGGKYEARELAREFQPSMILTNEASAPLDVPEKIGDTLLNFCGQRGKAVGRMDLNYDRDKGLAVVKGMHYEPLVNDPVLDDIHQLVEEWKRKAMAARAAPIVVTAAPPSEFIGAVECAKCHAEQHTQWAGTPHAKAFDKLKAEGKAQDAALVRRSVTGYGQFGGFTSEAATPLLANVQCEACHGAGRRHRDEQNRIKYYQNLMEKFPDRKIDITPKVAMRKAFDAKFCMSCHDTQFDADFDFDTALPAVKH